MQRHYTQHFEKKKRINPIRIIPFFPRLLPISTRRIRHKPQDANTKEERKNTWAPVLPAPYLSWQPSGIRTNHIASSTSKFPIRPGEQAGRQLIPLHFTVLYTYILKYIHIYIYIYIPNNKYTCRAEMKPPSMSRYQVNRR